MKSLGLDIGTTTISAVVLHAEDGRVAEARTIQNGSFIETEHEWEFIQDTAVILKKATAVVDELLEKYPDVTSIGLTGQMHGILYLDEEGKAISPLYTWQDGRANIPEFHGKTLTECVYEESGVRIATGYGLATHLYHCRMGLVPEKAVSLCTVGDYLGMTLTGRKKPLMHISNAASLGFFDSKNGRFLEETLQELGMDTAILPEVCDGFDILGEYRGIPVGAALGDNQASFLGSVGFQDQVILLNMGTGGQISVLSDCFFEAPGIEARPLTKGRYLLAGASLCGGRAYAILERFFRRFLQEADGEAGAQYDCMARLAERGMEQYGANQTLDGDSERMQVRTTFNGTRVNPDLRGSITGISEENFTPEGLVYGVLSGMAQELYEMYETIREGTGIRATKVVASGNGLRKNEVLQKICGQMFGVDPVLAPYEEEAACGAAVSVIRK